MALIQCAAIALCATAVAAGVWPPPQSIVTSGAPLALSPDFSITTAHGTPDSARLAAGIARASALIAPAHVRAARAAQVQQVGLLRTLEIEIAAGATEHLGIETKYDYTLTVDPATPGRATASAYSIYGAMYALETFAQLIDRDCSGKGAPACAAPLLYSAVRVVDAPDYQWRGLMIDSGRRFVPMDTLKNLVDTMAAVKLNVLHLHASDMCRFGVESKLYPNLTSSLQGIHGGFYSQDDVKELIAYAGDRGMRVVPEFDIPGHSRGWIPVEADGLQFCSDAASRTQLDGTDATYKVLHAVLGEMAALFTDEVFNIGSDETGAEGICTVATSLAVEKRVLDAVEKEFGKTAQGWEEVLFDAGAATNKTIVNAWARYSAADITATGRRAVESKDSAFYFTSAAPGGPQGWSKCWYDIGHNVPAAQMPLLLGGEMSMWTDLYCYVQQCGAPSSMWSGSSTPVGAPLFAPSQDAAFGKSIGGMIWPRGYVGAAAFWNFNSTADPSADAFVASIWATNDALAARGSLVCPTNCSCDQLSACGKPYELAPTPAPPPAPTPAAGSALELAPLLFGSAKAFDAFGEKQGSTRDLLDASLAAPSAVSTMSEEEWKKGFEYEIAFWDNWFKSKGSQWPDDYKERLKADKPFYFWNQLKKTAAFGEKHFTALSVGAGPLERAGFVVSPWLGLDATLEMIATDPLAKVYDTVLMKYGVVPPLRTRYAKGEELASYFAADFFDISYSLNALDHVQEPMLVLHQMVIVTKPGHQVIIEGNSNEAINENYVGFHQWNNACDNGKFIIWSRGKPTIDVAAVLGPVAKSVTCSGQTGRVLVGKMVAIITKAL